jgi:hypothetical protein
MRSHEIEGQQKDLRACRAEGQEPYDTARESTRTPSAVSGFFASAGFLA